ncbi:MAG: MBOAT family protein [Bacteroidetes bacterium]|nr:MBOAT family protein [Bacteroidota bacterium]
MLFNSIDFAIFLPVVFCLYWLLAKYSLRSQNVLIVVASYIFYGYWDWRFLFLIFFSSIVDFSISHWLDSENKAWKRKALLWSSIIVNLGILGFFKYYNFFLDNFVAAFKFLGQDINPSSLNIILPVGISFYTFQTLSYTIDVYRGKLKSTNDLIAFSAFVSFFPQLVAGPIERATHLLPQFSIKRKFNYPIAADGMRQIVWGLFKKIVIADNCAEYANYIFENSGSLNGVTLALGALFFTFQIYGDFSGYSDIAIGTARLFGFDLMRNFAFPYFSRDVAEFWRRWHISLSTWFRDYVYIPLGGSRGTSYAKIRNIFIIFIVSGFWHGANWTFIVWGALNALYFLPLLIWNKNRVHTEIVAQGKLLPSMREILLIASTFGLTVLTWVFFRADSLTHAFDYLLSILKNPGSFLLLSAYLKYKTILLLITFFFVIEWLGRERNHALEAFLLKQKRILRHSFYYSLILIILWFGGQEQEFIYFQF